MLDTQIPQVDIAPDTESGPHPRLTPAAIERAKEELGVEAVDDLWQKLGFSSRMTFWRARRGRYDIRLGHALTIADKLGWPLPQVFDNGEPGGDRG